MSTLCLPASLGHSSLVRIVAEQPPGKRLFQGLIQTVDGGGVELLLMAAAQKIGIADESALLKEQYAEQGSPLWLREIIKESSLCHIPGLYALLLNERPSCRYSRAQREE